MYRRKVPAETTRRRLKEPSGHSLHPNDTRNKERFEKENVSHSLLHRRAGSVAPSSPRLLNSRRGYRREPNYHLGLKICQKIFAQQSVDEKIPSRVSLSLFHQKPLSKEERKFPSVEFSGLRNCPGYHTIWFHFPSPH